MAWIGNPAFLEPMAVPAIQDRQVLNSMGMQKGVYGDGDFLVTLTSGMLLHVAFGKALIKASHPTLGNRGLYHVEADDNFAVTIPAASGTNPRIDQIVLVVSDPSYDPTLETSTPEVRVIPGTPTAGATLYNRNGAVPDASLPPNSLRIADVLVPLGAASILSTNIRDRRPWARGCAKRVVRGGTDASSNNTSTNPISDMILRCEITGDHPIEVIFSGVYYTSVSSPPVYFRPLVAFDRLSSPFTTGYIQGNALLTANPSNDGGWPGRPEQWQGFSWRWMGWPGPEMTGSLRVFPAISNLENPAAGHTTYIGGTAERAAVFTVRELMHGPQPTFPTGVSA
jgi:hypothetical protein